MDTHIKEIMEARKAKYLSENTNLAKLEEEHVKRVQESQNALSNIRGSLFKNTQRAQEIDELLSAFSADAE